MQSTNTQYKHIRYSFLATAVATAVAACCMSKKPAETNIEMLQRMRNSFAATQNCCFLSTKKKPNLFLHCIMCVLDALASNLTPQYCLFRLFDLLRILDESGCYFHPIVVHHWFAFTDFTRLVFPIEFFVAPYSPQTDSYYVLFVCRRFQYTVCMELWNGYVLHNRWVPVQR